MSLYVEGNPRTKKALKELVAKNGEVYAWQPGPFSDGDPRDGEHTAEGPHYPEPHKWYARVLVQGGRIVKVLR